MGESRQKKSHVPLTIGVAAAIFMPVAYLLGLRFYQGYLGAFGVESDGFPISTPDAYVYSYQIFGFFLLAIGEYVASHLKALFEPPVIYWAAAGLAATIGCVYGLLKLRKFGMHHRLCGVRAKIKAVVSRLHWNNNDFTKSAAVVLGASYLAILIATSAAALALFWWLFSLSAHAKGEALARERIDLFIKEGCHADQKTKWNTCFFVTDDKGNTLHEGLLIAISDKEIAVFKKDGSYVFARQDGFLLRRKLH